MYWTVIVFFCGLALALGGLVGAFPVGIIVALVIAAGAVVWFVVSGREGGEAAQLVSPPAEPTGEVRPPTAGDAGSAQTANERIEA